MIAYRFRMYIIPSKHLLELKTSWTRLQDMSWRRLQHVFSVTILRLPRRLEDVLEDEKLLRWRRLEDVLKTCLEDVLKTCLKDVWKTYLEDVFKTSGKQRNLNVYIFDLANLHLANLHLTNLRRIQNALIRTQ